MIHLLCRVTFHEIWSCASDLHSKDHEYLICIIASDSDDSLFKTHHRRHVIIVLGSVDNLKYCIRNFPIINPVTVVPYHFASHRCEDLEWGYFNVHLFQQEILWPVDVCRKPLPYHAQLIVLVAVLMFLLFNAVICYYVHCFLFLSHFGTGIIVFVAAALEDVGLCWPSSRHLPGNESVWSWEDWRRSDCVGMLRFDVGNCTKC